MQAAGSPHRQVRITLLIALATLVAAGTGRAQPPEKAKTKAKPQARPVRMAPGGKYRMHDMARPRPAVVEPGQTGVDDRPGQAPSDAVVLFGGNTSDLARWERRSGNSTAPAEWTVEGGVLQVPPRGGNIVSKETFGNCQIHIEWATPAEVKGNGQGRSNSGIFLGGFGELQLLDSSGNDTYPDGQAAALYGHYPPLVNASRPPGHWQTMDIYVDTERRDSEGKVTRPSRLTVVHNGILVHHAVEIPTSQRDFPIGLQDHNNPMRFRNIWVRRLRDYDEGGTPPPQK
jgi:hypothetical protein